MECLARRCSRPAPPAAERQEVKKVSYRRDGSESFARTRAWHRFLQSVVPVLAASGLSEADLGSDESFSYLLMHGYLEDYPNRPPFSVDALEPQAYAAFKRLAEAYFDAGYPYCEVMALRNIREIRWFRVRYDKRETSSPNQRVQPTGSAGG